MPLNHRTRMAELTELAVTARLAGLLTEPSKAALGAAVAEVGGGFILTMRNDPHDGNWNMACGLGITEPVTEQVVAEVIDVFREGQSPSGRIKIAPEALPADWAEICAAHGLTHEGGMAKLVASVDEIKPVTTDLRVGPVDERDAEEWAALLFTTFGLPDHFDELYAATFTDPDFRPFAAWDGDKMVAGANLFLYGESASLNSGATLESHRNRGAQSALLAERTRVAAEAGCRWVVSETGTPDEGESNPSLNNMLRLGFTRLYDRPTWVWRP
ncbi:GNAT family N-acetyltransferase [Actinoplanes solisilvae]|uniref:GNAT family N-acetyltransferase n=1 Tax=Actinoplanes solisilvae TaxID=2486853 RepID=UPI000FDCA623|nr:GNAT family N-acetyltransferase [Actinoplanes solisilvae]